MSDASTGLGRTAARGAAVSLGGQVLRVLLQMASVVILARLLAPKDYGLLAMATVVVGVAEIFRDFGLSAAAIQARSLSTAQRDTLFWINTAIGAFLTVLIAASAPLLADLYDQPQLIGIVQVLSVIFLLNGATTQYRVALTRELRFRALVAVDVVAPAVGLLTAIFLALVQAGYWALVAQQIAQAGTLLLGVAICARWLPGRPRRRTGVRSMLRFGGTMVGTQLIGYAGNNVDSLILGLREGPVILGLYNRAFQLVMTPFNQVRAPITQVALPVFSKLQDEPARFDAFLVRGQLALGYGLAVPLALVAGASVPVTELFLGDKWMPIAPAVSCLAAAAIFQLLAYVGYWVYVSRGLTGQLLRYSVVSAAIRITCVLVGSQWGLYGVAVGYAVAPALAWPVSLWWLGRCTRLPTAALYAGAGRVLLVCGVTGPAAWAFAMWTSHWPSVAALALVLLVAVALVATFLLLPGHRRDATDLRTTIRLVTSRR